MRVTKDKAAEHRAAIVTAAARLFREKGFDGVNVAEIMREAGLTHGGFYGHFASKDALAAEACALAFAGSNERLRSRSDLAALLDAYLSAQHRDHPGNGCPMAAYGSDIARQGEAVQRQFCDGMEDYLAGLAGRLGEPGLADDERADVRANGRAWAILMLSAAAGGLMLARAAAQSAPDLSAEILRTVRDRLRELAKV
jgi:TetR/AcrR family transcriptional repressor of nem operon